MPFDVGRRNNLLHPPKKSAFGKALALGTSVIETFQFCTINATFAFVRWGLF
jgi:hypothetical protein